MWARVKADSQSMVKHSCSQARMFSVRLILCATENSNSRNWPPLSPALQEGKLQHLLARWLGRMKIKAVRLAHGVRGQRQRAKATVYWRMLESVWSMLSSNQCLVPW